MTDSELRIDIEELARVSDKPAWMVARSLANLIEKGLLDVTGGTKEEAIQSLRAFQESYASA